MRAVNVTAAQNLYAAAAASGVSRWLQVSSIAALGRPTGYAATKREFDQWLEGRGDRI
jgi:nucleoside-diphosphate-sugar epimerase